MTDERSSPRAAVQALVANRIPVYLGGLACIGAVTALETRLPAVDRTARTVVVAVALGVMVLTYAAELWQRRSGGDQSTPPISGRARAVALLGLVGVAAGVAFVGTGQVVGGLLFFVGGLAIFQQATAAGAGEVTS